MQHRNTKIIIPNREEPLDEKKKKNPSSHSTSKNEWHGVKNSDT